MNLTCYQITHDGEGDRGEKVEVLSRSLQDPRWYAKEAADYFDEQEQRRDPGLVASDFDGGSQVIEVTGHPANPGIRFRVRCSVVRTYKAFAP